MIVEKKIRDKRRSHDRNLPFNGISIAEFNEPKIPLNEVKLLTHQELGYNIKQFDCPNCFHELSERLWKECKYQYIQVMGFEKAYDLFIDVMFLWIRSKIHQWDETKKSGQFFGWCKTSMFNNLLSETRNSDFKRNKNSFTSLNQVGEFTNLSVIEFNNGIFTDSEIDIENIEFQKNSIELKLIQSMEKLDKSDKDLLYKSIVDKTPLGQLALEMNTTSNLLTTKINRLKKQLKKELA